MTLTGVGVTTTAITANGSAATTALSNQPGGAGGAVQITSTNGISTTAIGASGGAATTINANGGNAGSITITNSTAGDVATTTLTAGTGAATGTGTGGTAGAGLSVTNTAGNIRTTTISTAGGASGNGGNVVLNASGTVSATLNSTITTSGGAPAAGASIQGTDAGNVTISGSAVTMTLAAPGALITANGGAALGLANARGGNAGAIAVTASGGAIDLTNGNLSAVGGAAAAGVAAGGAAKNITLGATGNVTANAITLGPGAAFGSAGPGGTPATLSVSGANVALGAITATGGLDGNGSAVTVNSPGTLSTGAITDNGGSGNANTAGGNAGAVSLTSNGALSTGTVTANGGSGGAGTAAGGNAGTITLANASVAGGTVTSGTLTARTGAATGATLSGTAGSVSVTESAAVLLQTGAIDVSGQAGGAGGSVTLTSAGDATVTSAITASGGALNAATAAAGRNSGNITIRGANRTLSGAVTASGGAAIVAGNAGGNAGTVLLTGSNGTAATAGTLSALALTTSTGSAIGTVASGTPGSITLEGTTVSATTLTTTGGNNGAGGAISATASGPLNVTGAIVSSGGTANAGAAGSNAGNVTLSGNSMATLVSVTASGSSGNGSDSAGGNGGNVSVTASGNAFSTGAISTLGGNGVAGNAAGGNAGTITLDAGGATPTVTLNGNLTATGGNRSGTAAAGAGALIWLKDPVLLNAAAVTASAGGGSAGLGVGGNAQFDGAIDSTGGARALTVNTNGATIFSGAVGATSALSTLTTDASGTTRINGATVTTMGAETFGDAVTLGTDTTVNAGSGAITFSNTIDGAYRLTATSTGNATFSGAIGAVTPLAKLSAGAQTVSIGAATVSGGAGSGIDLTGSRNIVAGGALTSNGSPITLLANAGGTAGTFVGIALNVATLDSGTGNITLTGTGGNAGAGDHGIQITNSSLKATGSGTITLTGTGGGTSGSGVTISNAVATQVISSTDGNIAITGTASGAALDTVYSGFGESSLTTTGLGTVSLRALGSGDANGLSIGTTGTALDYYGSALNQWQRQTASNLVFSGLGVTKTTGGDSTWTITAPKGVVFSGAAGISVTSGKLDLVIAPAAGAISLGSGTFRSNGGNITLAGGSNPGGLVNGAAPATGAQGNSVYVDGIDSAATIDAGAGSVWMMGTGTAAASNANLGISLLSGASVQTAGAGTITLIGNGGGSGASGANTGVLLTGATLRSTGSGAIAVTGNGGSVGSGGSNMGVRLNTGSTIQTTAGGNITLVGNGGNTASGSSNRGVLVSNGNTVQATGTGAISITGHSGDGGTSTGDVDNQGADVQGTVAGGGGAVAVVGSGGNGNGNYNWGTRVSGTVSNIGAGTISIVGTAGGNPGSTGLSNYGIGLSNGTVTAVDGNVTLVGTGGNSGGVGNNGLQAASGSGTGLNTIRTTGSGDVMVTAIAGPGGTGAVINVANTLRTTGSGNITLLNDSISLTAANAINSIGDLTIRPVTAGTTLGVGSAAAGTLALSDPVLADLTWGSGRLLTLGGASAGATTVNTAFVFANPIAVVSGAGADITLAAPLVSTSSATGPTLTLAAGRNFLNTAGAAALDPGAGVWRVWSTDPGADSRGGLAPAFKQYNATYGVTPVLGSGNGALYTVAPVLTPVLAGPVAKVYDGTTVATLAPANTAVTGTIDGDSATIAVAAASYDTRNVGAGKIVTGTGVTLTSASNGAIPVYGYALSSSSAAAPIGTITAAPLTLGAVADSRVYNGTTNSAGAPTITGLVGGDTVTALGQSFDSRNAGSRTLVVNGGYTVNDGNGGANYSVATNSSAGTITQAVLTLGAVADTRTYNGTTASAAAPTIAGLVAGDTVTSLAQSFDSRNAGARNLIVNGGYTVNDGNGGVNYSVATTTASGSITQAALTLGAVADSRVYNGTSSSAAAPTVAGLVAGDTITSLAQGFDSKNAGPRTLTPSGYVVNDGNSGANYSVTTQTAAGTITQAALVIGAAADTKVYDATVSSSAVPSVVTGLVGSDTVTALVQTFDSKNAGARTLAPSGYVVNDGNSGANYSVTTQSAAGTITPAALVIGATSDTKVYDATTSSAAAPTVVSGLKGSDTVTSLTQAFDSKNAGSRTLTPSGYSVNDGNAGANYSVTTTTAAGTITQAALVIGAAADTKVYDATTTSTAAATVVSGLVGTDTVTSLTQTFDSKNAGARTLAPTGYSVNDGNSGANYSVTTQSAAGTISQAALVIGATSDTKVYDATTSSGISPTVVSGLKGTDFVLSLTQTFDSKNAGARTLTPTGYTVIDGNAGANYSVTTQTAAGTITPAALVIGATSDTKVYDATTTSTAAATVVSGLVGSDTVTSLTQTFDSKNAGARTLTPTGYTVIDGNAGGNYMVTTQTAAGTITPAALVIGATSDTKVYDATTSSGISPTVVSGLKGTDSVTSLTQTFDSKNAGARTLTPTGYTVIDGNAGANYSVTTQTAAGTITQAALVIGAAADTKVYDATTTSTAAATVVSGLKGSDNVTSLTQAFDSKTAGTRTLTPSGYSINDGNSGANYSVTTQTAAGTITPAALVIGAASDIKVYDATTSSSAAPSVVSGLKGSDTVTSLTQAFDSKNAGTRTLTPSGYSINDGNSGANYSVTTQTAAGTITPAALVIGAASDIKVYDATTSSSAAPSVVSGLKGNDTVTSLTQAFDSKNAGARTLTPNGYVVNDGNSGANYSVTTQVAAGVITPAPLSVVADDKTRAQAQPDPPLTASFRGFVAGETPLVLSGVLDLSTTATAISAPGTYPIVPSGLSASNYTITFSNGVFSIIGPSFTPAMFGSELAQRDLRLTAPIGTRSDCFRPSLEATASRSWIERPFGTPAECTQNRFAREPR